MPRAMAIGREASWVPLALVVYKKENVRFCPVSASQRRLYRPRPAVCVCAAMTEPVGIFWPEERRSKRVELVEGRQSCHSGWWNFIPYPFILIFLIVQPFKYIIV